MGHVFVILFWDIIPGRHATWGKTPGVLGAKLEIIDLTIPFTHMHFTIACL
jgi:hypothetical protein